MRADVYWIDDVKSGRLGIMARPRAGDWLEDKIAGWQAEGIEIVVSLLEPDEVRELGLEDEAAHCDRRDIAFVSFPIADRSVPVSVSKVSALTRTLVARLDAGASIAIHCRAGIGRSALIAACCLIVRSAGAEEAFGAISRARGVPVPDTNEQRQWAAGFLPP